MRLAELLTYVIGDLRVYDGDDVLYEGHWSDCPNELLTREVLFVSTEESRLRIGLMKIK